MSGPIEVTDPADPRLADYVSLTDADLRTSLEARHGLFIAEGDKVIRRALAAGYPVRSMLLTAAGLTRLAGLAGDCAAPVYLVSDEVARRLTGYRVHRGALAAMARPPLPEVSQVLATARRVVVLEDLVDHGNVGAVFAVPYTRMADWYGGLGQLRAAGFRLLALTPDQSATPIGTALPAGAATADQVALLLGCEGDGLSARWMREADEAVCIPMSPSAMALGVDSLNVVAAAAVACHALVMH